MRSGTRIPGKADPPPPHRGLRFAALWLLGVDLRVTLLAVPPVLVLIHRDLKLSETGVGALTSLPVLLFAAAALPGSLLIARFGARRAAITGVFALALASGLRGAGTSPVVLFAMTVLMGAGIAIVQPAVPALIARWTPAHIGSATALYVNGILIGETLGAALTLPLVLPAAGGRWEVSFALWAAPVLLTAVALAALGPILPEAPRGRATRWWPDWRRAEAWQLGLVMGGVSAAYFGLNAFIPDYLRAVGRTALIGPCLTALNAGQLPSSLVALAAAPRLVGRRAPFLAIGGGLFAALGAFLVGTPAVQTAGAAVLGFCAAFGLVLALALPPLVAEAGDVHRLSAGMLAVGYGCAFLFPLLGGAAWDGTHVPAAAFLPVALGAATCIAAAATLPRILGFAEGRPAHNENVSA